VAASDTAVLIRGESGTGKELVAGAIQRLSRRRAGPFETLNCADLTRELLRSELFGHERGAFTGAVSRTPGLLAALAGGTLFMDEIGELATDAQAMLLRFLQEREGRPVGAARSAKADVRVIAATHRDLEAAVERGAFREDMYWRLYKAVVEVPPLRARREDIPLLVEHFLEAANRGEGLEVEGVNREAMAVLEAEDWPGNVRELDAVVTRAMRRRRRGWVRPEDVIMPRLRRESLPGAVRGLGPALGLTPVQREALRLVESRGEVRRGDLIARCGVSREAARRALAGLERAGSVRREGSGRGARYVMASRAQ
jgi:DNA-binding NtrC family response regulator